MKNFILKPVVVAICFAIVIAILRRFGLEDFELLAVVVFALCLPLLPESILENIAKRVIDFFTK